MRLSLNIAAASAAAIVSATTPVTLTNVVSATSSPSITNKSSVTTPFVTGAPTTELVIQPATSAVITLPPNKFELYDPRRKRQECFNDQGFRVDCATWTGYYYTWGPSSDPYEGGPGEGGGGSGGGEPSTTIIYGGDASLTVPYGLAGVLLGLLAFLL